MSSSSESESPQNLEPENDGSFRYNKRLKRLSKEFPDIYEDDTPFEVWGWSVPQRRRIIKNARDQIENEKTWCALAQTAKGMSTPSEMPRVWRIVAKLELRTDSVAKSPKGK